MSSFAPFARIFYVYAIFRPNGVPCYIGKGHGDRAAHHEKTTHNRRLARIFARAGGSLPVVVIRDGLTECEAFAAEIALITALGRANLKTGPLVNLTDGGDGQTGWVPSAETRQRISIGNRGKKHSDATRQKMSAARAGKKKSPAHRAALARHLASVCSSPEGAKRRWQDPEQRARARQRALDQHARMTPEQKIERAAKISQRTRECMTQDVRAKISASRKRSTHVND